MQILLKYQNIINKHKNDNLEINNFFENLGFKDYKINMEGSEFKIILPATQKFIMKINEDKIKVFCKEKGFIFKNII